MQFVTSEDGTSIAYERRGGGPAVVLVGGGLDDGPENAALVPELARHFTVYNYARRGRGDSGDTAPYAVAREIEDLAALVDLRLVATGGIPDQHMGDLQPGFFDAAADAIASALPNAERRVVEGQSHVAEPTALAAVLAQFFKG